MQNNEELKALMYSRRIPQWRLGKKLGVSDMTVYKHLRDEMPEEEYQRYKQAIEELVTETGVTA